MGWNPSPTILKRATMTVYGADVRKIMPIEPLVKIYPCLSGKPLCRYCQVPCDPFSREWRAQRLCDWCYAHELPPPMVIKKEKPCPTLK